MRKRLVIVALVMTIGGGSKKGDSADADPAASFASTRARRVSRSAGPGTSFEGRIVLAIKDEVGRKLPASITYDIKGNKVRYASASTRVRAIGDVATHHAYAIDRGKKSYREVDTEPAFDARESAMGKVRKTGKTQNIAGIDCENWTIDSGDEQVDVCAAKGIAFFDLARDSEPGSVEPSWATPLTEEKAFPLRVVVHDKDGMEQFRAEAAIVIPKKLDDALFRLPTGLKKAEVAVK